MGAVNKVILVGNLGRDAELRYTPGGTGVATLNLATTEKWKDRAGKLQERTEWHRVIVWGQTAENLSEYLLKGKQIYVEGKLQTRKWTDKDGTDRYTTEVRSDRIVLLGGNGGAARNGGQRRSEPARQNKQQDSSAADPFDQPGGFEDDGGGDFANAAGAWPEASADDEIPF